VASAILAQVQKGKPREEFFGTCWDSEPSAWEEVSKEKSEVK
jgi:hypothetical protein